MSSSVLRMVILGRQGSGKGTQSLRLAAQYGCVHLSTGDVLRAAVEEGTELGQQAAGIMNAGGLVGDDIMIPLVAERVAKPDIMSGGVLLDGFPNSRPGQRARSDAGRPRSGTHDRDQPRRSRRGGHHANDGSGS